MFKEPLTEDKDLQSDTKFEKIVTRAPHVKLTCLQWTLCACLFL